MEKIPVYEQKLIYFWNNTNHSTTQTIMELNRETLQDLQKKRAAENEKWDAEWKKRQEEIDAREDERQSQEFIVGERVKSKLQVDWEDNVFHRRVFDELRKSDFKRLSFLSDILEDWDLSHLTGVNAMIANAGLALDRKTSEIDFYDGLFKELTRDQLIHFLMWAVIGEELDESVIDKMTNKLKLKNDMC